MQQEADHSMEMTLYHTGLSGTPMPKQSMANSLVLMLIVSQKFGCIVFVAPASGSANSLGKTYAKAFLED